MKVLELRVTWDGYYGSSVNEYMILPLEWNDKVIEKLDVGTYDREVYLGEIAGKHSMVYGDLEVSIVNLAELSYTELINYLEGSSVSEFEAYFEHQEEIVEEYDEEELEEFNNNKQQFYETIGIKYCDKWYIESTEISELFVEKLINKYKVNTESIIVKAEDYTKAIDLLFENNIETY